LDFAPYLAPYLGRRAAIATPRRNFAGAAENIIGISGSPLQAGFPAGFALTAAASTTSYLTPAAQLADETLGPLLRRQLARTARRELLLGSGPKGKRRCAGTVRQTMGELSRSPDANSKSSVSSSPQTKSDSCPRGQSERGAVKVLVVDDEPVTLESLTGLLAEWGYDPVAVRSGSDALNRLLDHDGPSLAVLDWMLPDIHGTEICRRLRESQTLRYIYLILLTGRDESSDVVEGLSAGADDYLRKPCDPLELRARLDVGSRIVVQKALRESEERFQSAFEHAGVSMALTDLNGRFLQVNSALCDFLGYESSELLATNFQAITHPDDLPKNLSSLQSMVDGTLKLYQTEKRYRHKEGHEVWGALTVSPVLNVNGKAGYFVVQIQDISRRKQALQALGEQETQLQLILDSTVEAIYGLDLKGNCTFSNRACLKLSGYQHPSDLLGKHMHSLLHHSCADGSPLPEERCQIYRAFRMGQETHVDSEVMWKADGTCFPCEYWSHPVRQDGKVVGGVVTFVDITSRKLAEDARRAAHAESEFFINSVPSILIGTDAAGRISRWNLAAANAFALAASAVRGKSLKDCGIKWSTPNAEVEIDSWSRIRKGSQRVNLPFEKDGTQHFVGLNINRVTFGDEKNIGLLITGTDITERKHLEEQLRQAQKLEAVGQLAAGIAHEINTPTQYMGDNTTFVKQSWPAIGDLARAAHRIDQESKTGAISSEATALLRRCLEEADLEYLLEEIPKAIDQSLEGMQRVAKIVHAMKEFSHPGSEEKSALDINRAIEMTITVARNEWKYVADVETQFDPDLPLVHCHGGEFNQVILNLLVNAAHAIRQALGDRVGDKGKISIATKQDQNWVEISIQDTGGGIPEEIQSRIFEPFFTTKPVGQGTGQGLALAHTTIVRKHGGRIWFETILGKGTTFFIRLPVTP
jgi:PAS domain S-box-containing protein